MDTKLPWSLGKGSYKSSLWSRARQRSTLSPSCFSAIRHGQRQKESTSSNKRQCNCCNSYFKIWSVLAAGFCCIMADALTTDLHFCSCHLLRIQTKCLLLPCLSTPTGDPDHQTSQDLICPSSLLHVSDGPGNMELCLVPALSPALIHLRGFPVGQVPTLLLIGELLLLSVALFNNKNIFLSSLSSPHLCNSLLAISH